MPSIQYGNLGFHFNNLLMQKLEVGTILGFWQLATCNLQRFVGIFLYGNWTVHNGHQCPLLIYNYTFYVHLFADFGQFLGFWVSEMVIPNGYHFLFNLLFPSSILI
jgi:hypothetical protein